jgi:hypothetical protein
MSSALARWALGLSLATVPAAASAAYFCTEPRKPSCLDLTFGGFKSEWEFDNCRMEVEAYVDHVKEYADCLDMAKQDKVREAKKVIDRFNCIAKGGNFCP